MTETFHQLLVNGGFGDPALYLQCTWERRALLFDLGDISRLRPAEILKVSDVFVSHTHIDHFVGFDRLLRVMLNREKSVRFHGPEGLIRNVAGKLAGYTWNLVDDYRLRLHVHELGPERVRHVVFSCKDRFRARSALRSARFAGIVLDDDRFLVEARHLDHAVPCLGFSLRERVHLNVNRDRMRQLGWEIGPWLGRVKAGIAAGRAGAARLRVPVRTAAGVRHELYTLGEIAAEIILETPGVRIAYVTDVKHTPENERRVLELARDADHFYCEAAFLERDADHAERKFHLTARQAGDLARRAGAKRLRIFHFSPKYEREEALLHQEAEAAHRGGGDPPAV